MTRRLRLGVAAALALLASLPGAVFQNSVMERGTGRAYDDPPLCAAVWFDRQLDFIDVSYFVEHARLPVPYWPDHVGVLEALLRANVHDRTSRRQKGT